MNLNDALATAKAKGWQEDWTRPQVAHQMSVERDGILGFVKVLANGLINWSVSVYPDTAAERRVASATGTAPSLDAAIRACETSISEAAGTLF